jgi:uncharacterized protein YgbK (DUF1537 family)
MIAVIADDFTGAAEIGGLGIRFGMNVEIETEVIKDSKADLLIIATDTRSLSNLEAAAEIFKITKLLKELNVEWIYKKTDSVMRGHILNELTAVIKASGKNKVLLVPANPSFGRTISGGKYYVNSMLLHETDFSQDPEFAPSTSDVLELLGKDSSIKTLIGNNFEQIIHENSIVIGEAKSDKDLDIWARRLNHDLIPAGASGFFEAILKLNGFKTNDPPAENRFNFGNKKLFVFGSAFSLSRETIEHAKKNKKPVFEMPYELFINNGSEEILLNSWSQNVVNAFEKENSIIIGINQPIVLIKGFAKRLRQLTAALVRSIVAEVELNELFIEGGATTYEIVKSANFKEFIPVQELSPGVIRMRIQEKSNMYMTIKPGSYSWPEEVWDK